MSSALPRLRSDIDALPSPIPDRPGLLLRDPLGYTEAHLVVPPAAIGLLRCLDGQHTERDAQLLLSRAAGGTIVYLEQVRELVAVLRSHGFLETEELKELKEKRHQEFVRAPVREPSLAGSAYPASEESILAHFSSRVDPLDGGPGNVEDRVPLAIASPHVSPEGGFASYRAAYDFVLDEALRTFVILGTSHYGAPERFGLTRKPFRTPLGTVATDGEKVDFLVERAGDAVLDEDYCHAREHSIELQVLFLQYRLRGPFRIVPVLCGPFVSSLDSGRPPESLDCNRRFFDALGELAERHPDLVWVLGVDMAHVGHRYGDPEPAVAHRGRLVEVEAQDRARLERVCAGDAEGFFELVHPGGDPLHWCGYPPIYTFLKSIAPVRAIEGRLRYYQQWNIDPASVVSFAAVHFEGRARSGGDGS